MKNQFQLDYEINAALTENYAEVRRFVGFVIEMKMSEIANELKELLCFNITQALKTKIF